jgi:hypothetical protein
MAISLENLAQVLDELEAQCPDSTLTIYVPEPEPAARLAEICRLYLAVGAPEQAKLMGAVAGRTGVQNHLLGYAYACAGQLKASRAGEWLRLGLAAAALAEGGMDPRDVLLALAELYVTAEAAGLEPAPAFEAVCGRGDFGDYAVVQARRRQ